MTERALSSHTRRWTASNSVTYSPAGPPEACAPAHAPGVVGRGSANATIERGASISDAAHNPFLRLL